MPKNLTIDAGADSVLATCPSCAWRGVHHNEEVVRRDLLIHVMTAHSTDAESRPLKNAREATRKWLARRDIFVTIGVAS